MGATLTERLHTVNNQPGILLSGAMWQTWSMDTFEIRRENLRAIVAERFAGNQSACAEAIDCKPPQVNRWLSTTANDPRRITEQSARHIEKALRLPALSLDLAPAGIGAQEHTREYFVQRNNPLATQAELNQQPNQEHIERILTGVLEAMGAERDSLKIEITSQALRLSCSWANHNKSTSLTLPPKPNIPPITLKQRMPLKQKSGK